MDKKIVVAADVGAPVSLIDALAKHNIMVIRAEEGETDDSWVKRSWKRKAAVYISSDKFIYMFTKVHDLPLITFPNGVRGRDLTKYLVNEVKASLNES